MLLGLFLVALLLFSPVQSNWWISGSHVVTDPEVVCRRPKRLKGRIASICRGKPALLTSIKEGVDLGIRHCQYQFRNRHWNCTVEKKSIRKVLLRDTRETGFVNAITAAGVTFTVTQACTRGEIIQCSCDSIKKGSNKSTQRTKLKVNSQKPGDWKWGGCNENVAYGYKKSKAFMDYPYRKRSDMKTLLRLHNNDAGRMAIRGHMQTKCKCHGLSGSCSFQTCWQMMPYFKEVSERLKERFDGATKVIPSNDGRSFLPERTEVKPPSKTDIVYAEETGDFCKYNRGSGSLGTQGRECNATFLGDGGCDILCCNRGYNSKIIRVSEPCRCQLVEGRCCDVQCRTCHFNRTVYTCR